MATAAAKRYARAVFELASDEGRVEEWLRHLTAISDLMSDPTVAAALENPHRVEPCGPGRRHP